MSITRSARLFILLLFLFAALLFFGLMVRVTAQTEDSGEPSDSEIAARGITFPIPELGNCDSKEACKSYCNDPTHMDACVAFAESHGLMNKDEAARAKQFKNKLQGGGGPGGCTSPQGCETFCRNIQNIEACVAFARSQGVRDRRVEDAEKLQKYLKSGGQMPGGCTSEESCKAYCSDFSHAEECYEFAKQAGITQVRSEVRGEAEGRFEGGIPPGQFQKFLELIKKGETPGGCTNKDACEAYCSDQAHREECIAFAEKAGFIKHEQAEMIKKAGGQGPGGCSSGEACHAYCSDQAHREECFKFAEEHGFIKPEEAREAKEGMVRLRAGFENAPPEVAECLKSQLGQNIIQDIQTGTLTPGPEIGERVRGCFEKFGRHGNPGEIFKNAPPEVLSCLKEKAGADFEAIKNGEKPVTPEIADTFRVCFQAMQFERGEGFFGGPGGSSSTGPGRFGPGGPGQMGPGGPEGQQGPRGEFNFQNFVKSAPPEIQNCLKEKLGDSFGNLSSGTAQPDPGMKDTIRSCFQSFRPNFEERGGEGLGRPMQGPMGGPMMGPGEPNFGSLPARVGDCIKNALGDDGFAKFQRGDRPTGDAEAAIGKCMSVERSTAAPGGLGPLDENDRRAPQPTPDFNGPSQQFGPRPLFGPGQYPGGSGTPLFGQPYQGTGQYPQYPTQGTQFPQYPQQYPPPGDQYPTIMQQLPPGGVSPPPEGSQPPPSSLNTRPPLFATILAPFADFLLSF